MLGVAQDAMVPHVDPGAVIVQPPETAGVPPSPQPFEVEEVPMVSGEVAPPVVVAPAANDERAIVVYQPAEAARNLLRGPLRPEAPLRVSPDWIRGIKGTRPPKFGYLVCLSEFCLIETEIGFEFGLVQAPCCKRVATTARCTRRWRPATRTPTWPWSHGRQATPTSPRPPPAPLPRRQERT